MSTTFLQDHPDGLILCGAYNIGKERIVCALQDKLGVKVYIPNTPYVTPTSIAITYLTQT